MNVKDLDIAKDLTQEERAVTGGSSNVANIGGPVLATAGGYSLFSPHTNVQIDAPVVTQTNVDPTTITEETSKVANVVGSLGTLIGQ
jgi:hypothetical protein